MKYCTNCGAPATGTPFCGQCGTPLTTGDAQGSSASAQRSRGPAHAAAPGHAPTATTGAGNPFADIPVADYARDALAFLLFVVSFGMPWDHLGSATDTVYVVLATLLSIVSLSLPYLKRAGVLPATWGEVQLRGARLIANAPYFVVVLVTIVLAYTESDVDAGRGVGVGVMFGLAGAVLAAQARQAELRDGRGDGRLWRLVAFGIAALMALTSVLSLVFFLVDVGDALEWSDVVLLVLVLAFFVVVPGLPLLGFARGIGARRDVLVVLGITALAAGFWQLGAESSLGGSWSLRLGGPAHLLWPALAASVTAAGLAGLAGMAGMVRTEPGPLRWIAPAGRLFRLIVVIGAFGVAISAVGIAAADTGRGARITALVLYLVVVAAGLVGRNALDRDPRLGRGVAMVASGVLAVVGIVLAAVLGGADGVEVGVFEVVAISAMLVFAVCAAVAVTAPRAVREEYGPVAVPAGLAGVTGRGEARPASGPTDAPASQAGSAAEPDAGSADSTAVMAPTAQAKPLVYSAKQAADPTTPLEVLADIAAKDPSLRPYVAANPSTYPDLLTWLGKLGDPAVDEALRARR